MPKLKLLASAVAQLLKGNPTFWGTSIAQGHVHFFFGVGFMMGLGKPQRHANFEVAIALNVAKLL